MTTDFYRCVNDPIEFNKKLDIITRGNVLYKADTDMEKPDFILESDKWIDGCNYIYVGGSINRYYFVNGTEYSQGRIIMKCSEDYLASHRSEILKLSGILERSGSKKKYNLYLNDDKTKVFNMTRTCTLPWLDSGGNLKSFRVNGSKTYSYILTLSGSGDTSNNDNNENQTEG